MTGKIWVGPCAKKKFFDLENEMNQVNFSAAKLCILEDEKFSAPNFGFVRILNFFKKDKNCSEPGRLL